MDNKKQSTRRKVIIQLIIIFFSAIILTSSFFLFSFVRESVYEEKKDYLLKQTDTTTNLINHIITQYSNYAGICASIVESDLVPYDDVEDYLVNFSVDIEFDGSIVIFVDDKGTWYSKDGTGRVSQINNYTLDTPDELCYIDTIFNADEECYIFRNRLTNPIPVTTNNGTSNIEYCGIVRTIKDVEKTMSFSFPYESNRFICDETGLMIFKDMKLGLLLKGSNIFYKYESVDFHFDESGTEMVKKIKNGEIVAGEFRLDGEKYFICTSPLNFNNWNVTFLILSDSLSSGDYVRTVTLFVLIISLTLVIAVSFLFTYVIRYRNGKMKIKIEHEANEYLQKASNAKSIFLSNMSHDIRTPINGILGMTYLAQKENNPEKTQQCLQKIDVVSNHLLSIINDVLDMSLIENDKVIINKKPHNLYTLIDNVLTIIEGRLHDRELELIKEFDELSCPNLLIDSMHLERVLVNILSNAIKYTKDGGKIYIRVIEIESKDNQSWIAFELEDTGIGMKPEFIDHIFEEFKKESMENQEKYRSTGLGMAISKKFVELMGGAIKVESTLYVGTKISIKIPFEHAVEEISQPVEQVNTDGKTILIVEDNDLNRMILKEMLESNNFVTVEANNGQKAVDSFIKSNVGEYSAIILDVLMPEMDGITAAKKIRELERPDAKSIPIIIMTANVYDETNNNLKEVGINDWLTKPVEEKNIIDTIKKHLKGDK